MKYKTRKDLVYAMAERARVLGDEPVRMLRLKVSTQDSITAALAETAHMSKSQLIEDILIEEFEGEMEEVEAEEEVAPKGPLR